MRDFNIKHPKYSTDEVLLKRIKVDSMVDDDVCRVTFTEGTYKGQVGTITAGKVKSYRIGSNGVIDCYYVPLEEIL